VSPLPPVTSHRAVLTSHWSYQKDQKRLGDYLTTLDSKNLDPLTWAPGKWSKVHNDGKSTTGGDFRSYTMAGGDGQHQVKVEMNAKPVLSVPVAKPFGGAEVKAALKAAYDAVC
jgi:hypothetical protein